MPSPFPGMDPFIESANLWGDFHSSMCLAIKEQLNEQLPRGFVASIDLYVWIHEPDAQTRARRIKPDSYVSEGPAVSRPKGRTSVVDAHRTVVIPAIERRERKSIRIEDLRSRRVVTTIELLSPSNKTPGEDRNAYLDKRNDYIAARVNYVEIDLLRGGERPPLGVPRGDLGDYYALVWRSWEFPTALYWSFTIRDPLPRISVPLTSDLADVPLSLQECFGRVYEKSRYTDQLTYTQPLLPRLTRQESAWVRSLLTKPRK